MGMVTAKTLTGDYGNYYNLNMMQKKIYPLGGSIAVTSIQHYKKKKKKYFFLQWVKNGSWDGLSWDGQYVVWQIDVSAYQTQDWMVRYMQAEKWIRYTDPTEI